MNRMACLSSGPSEPDLSMFGEASSAAAVAGKNNEVTLYCTFLKTHESVRIIKCKLATVQYCVIVCHI